MIPTSDVGYGGSLRSASTPDTQSRETLDITVILCTYNRCEDLAGALQSVATSQVADSVTWEVLVVDNNSTDQTRDVVEDFSRRYPGRFRYHFEPQQGLSHARNAGIANARGEVLVFTDDDVTVEPTWLQNLTAALLDSEWAGVAGRILPAQKFILPPWLSWNDFGGVLCAHFDLGDQPSRLQRSPYGANMAFRKSMFEKYGGFRIDLGPSPGCQIRNDDTEFGRRLLAAGEQLRYEPSAVVCHPVPQGRVTKEYLLSWWFDYGRAMIRERGERPDVCGVPRDYLAMISRAAEISVMSLRGMLAFRPHDQFRYKCRVRKSMGQIDELYRRSADRKRTKAARAAGTKLGSSRNP